MSNEEPEKDPLEEFEKSLREKDHSEWSDEDIKTNLRWLMTPHGRQRPQFYILDENHNAVPIFDIVQWGREFEKTGKRRVAFDVVNGIEVSTVFLGMDNTFGFGPKPELFETMTFIREQGNMEEFAAIGELFDESCWRYATWDEAVKGHETIVILVREAMK